MKSEVKFLDLVGEVGGVFDVMGCVLHKGCHIPKFMLLTRRKGLT